MAGDERFHSLSHRDILRMKSGYCSIRQFTPRASRAEPEHLLHNNGILVIRTDRGGQITYHGPGQIIAYLMLDLRRLKLGVRELVRKMEGAVIDLLKDYGVRGSGSADAPGVYVDGAKIAALGLKIKNGCCYHGLALNVDMDLYAVCCNQPLRIFWTAGDPDQGSRGERWA